MTKTGTRLFIDPETSMRFATTHLVGIKLDDNLSCVPRADGIDRAHPDRDDLGLANDFDKVPCHGRLARRGRLGDVACGFEGGGGRD
jgi:hypothetical protein